MMPQPKFTFDWFSDHIENWERWVPKDAKEYLEIGSFEGRSALWMLENRGVFAECVDPCRMQPGYHPMWEGYWKLLKQNLEPYVSKQRAFVHEMYSDTFFEELDPGSSYDVIYIDGDHRFEAVFEDIRNSWRVLRSGGVLILDDYNTEVYDVLAAWTHFCGMEAPAFEKLINWGNSWQLAVRKVEA